MTMKCGPIIFIITLLVAITVCSVTNRTKTTATHLEYVTENSRARKNAAENKKENPVVKTVRSENFIYLDDVLFALNSLDWSKDEEPCLNKTLQLLYSLRNFTLWAVWDWDSISSEPEGLLFGSRYQLGNFDECMQAPWANTYPELQTQYCLADILLERADRGTKKKVYEPYNPYQSALDFIQYKSPHSRPLNELTWGGCVPAACKPKSVERLIGIMIARSHLGSAGMRPRINVTETCQRIDQARPFDGPFYGFIAMSIVLITTVLTATFLNCRREENDSPSLGGAVIKALCIKSNAKNLMTMKKEGLEVFYGIRFLTICVIVVSHQVGFLNGGPIINGIKVEKEMHGTIGFFVLHNDLFVDSFFLLSGFLTVVSFFNLKTIPNPFIMILRRYVRLIVALSITIYYVSAVFAYTGTGPLWPRTVAGEEGTCRRNWWLNILMISNYINSDQICMVVSWYVPCDFHYFVATVLIYWLYNRSQFFGSACALAVMTASIIVPGYIQYANDLPAVQLFTYDFITDPRGNKQFNMTYVKSHTRAAAYIVGLVCGYVFMRYRDNGNRKIISRRWSILGLVCSLSLMMVVMFTGTLFFKSDDRSFASVLYGALNRPVWAFGVGLLTLSCSLGCVPFVKDFLSWYPWAPLSRLAYGIYLTHSVIIARNVYVTRTPLLNDYFEIINNTCGTIVVSSIASLIIFLVAEAPINNLVQICFMRVLFNNGQKNNKVASINDSNAIASTSKGHFQTNLPPNVEYLSKI